MQNNRNGKCQTEEENKSSSELTGHGLDHTYESDHTTDESIESGSSGEALNDGPALFTFKTWGDIAERQGFQDSLEIIRDLFQKDKKFQQRVQKSARSYIETKLSPELKSLWEAIRGDGQQAPRGERKSLTDLVVGLGMHYLLDSSALLLYLNQTEFDTLFYKNPLGSALVGLVTDLASSLQMRERDFHTLGEVTDSSEESPIRILGQIHYLILSKCLDVLAQMNLGQVNGMIRTDEKHIDSTYDLDFEGRSVVIPISVRSASFPASSYNSSKGVEALARHINEGVKRVCILGVDLPHVSSDLQANLISELANYARLAPELQNATTLTSILSDYFEMDESTGQPLYAYGLPVVKTTGEKYQAALEQNRQYGVEWQERYLPQLATTFAEVHFKDKPRSEIFEPALAAQLAAISPPVEAIPNYMSYYRHMLNLLTEVDIQKKADSRIDSELTRRYQRAYEVVETVPQPSVEVEDHLNLYAYFMVVCDFIIQAGLSAKVGKLAGFDKYTKSDMVDVLTRIYNAYRQLLEKASRSLSPFEGDSLQVVAPYTKTLREIARLVSAKGSDTDHFVNAVCQVRPEGLKSPPSIPSSFTNSPRL